MLAVKGIYDRGNIKLSDEVNINRTQNVIIVFPEHSEEQNDNEIINKGIYQLAEAGEAFDFLNNPEENIYFESDLKKRYINE